MATAGNFVILNNTPFSSASVLDRQGGFCANRILSAHPRFFFECKVESCSKSSVGRQMVDGQAVCGFSEKIGRRRR